VLPHKKKQRNYLNRSNLRAELIAWRAAGGQVADISEKLYNMFRLLVDELGAKACFRNYPFVDEMKEHALMLLIQYAHNFDPSYKHANAFAYCTQIAKNAFFQVIKSETKLKNLRKELYDKKSKHGSEGVA